MLLKIAIGGLSGHDFLAIALFLAHYLSTCFVNSAEIFAKFKHNGFLLALRFVDNHHASKE
jgi:hypothetical protein